ncbi:hypothetical protein GCM10027290_63090 [Micromonospora sonneratiae]
MLPTAGGRLAAGREPFGKWAEMGRVPAALTRYDDSNVRTSRQRGAALRSRAGGAGLTGPTYDRYSASRAAPGADQDHGS